MHRVIKSGNTAFSIIKTRVSVLADSSSSVRFHRRTTFQPVTILAFSRPRDLVHINNPNIRYKSAQRCAQQPHNKQCWKLPLYRFPYRRIPLGSKDFITFLCVISRLQLVDIIFSQLWQLSKPLFGWKARVQSDGWAATWKMASLCSIIITRRSVRSSNRNLWRASNALIGQLLPVASNQRFELLQLAGWPTNFSRYLEPPRRG